MEISVRLATQTELDEVGRITVEVYRDDGFIEPGDDYLHELADAAARARDAEVYVAVASDGVVASDRADRVDRVDRVDQVLGSVTYCRPGTPFAELALAGEGEFRMLGVARAARRRGIAEALVRRCINRSRGLSHTALVLSSMKQMEAAHRLYERLGFTRTPERDWSPQAGVDLLAFRLDLSAD